MNEATDPPCLCAMDTNNAIARVKRDFPFAGVIDAQRDTYVTIAATAQRYLPAGGRVLDFGAGSCDIPAVLSHLGYRCVGYDDHGDAWYSRRDYQAQIRAFATTSGVELRIIGERGTHPWPPTGEAGLYDMVMMHDVLEHLHDPPRELLNDFVELLKPGGVLFLTVPSAVNIRKRINVVFGRSNHPRFRSFYWSPGRWRGHVREYTKGDLASVAEYLGLERLELRACDHMLGAIPRRARGLYLAVTRFVPGWKDTWLLVARKPAGWTARRTLPPDEMRTLAAGLTNAPSFHVE